MATASINVVASIKDALKSINDFQRQSTDSLKKIEGSFNFLKTAAAAAVSVIVAGKISNFFSDAASAAAKEEEAIQALNFQMRLAGSYSEAAAASMQEYADAVESTTKFSNEAALQQLAFAKSLGLTDEKARLAVDAAIELSTVTGKDLDSSMRSLAGTLGGSTQQMGKLVPAVKLLTAEQLKAGDAIQLVADRFKGSAAAAIDTYSGALVQASNKIEDFVKSIGRVIINNEAVISVIKVVGEVFRSLTGGIEENSNVFDAFITSIANFVSSAIPVFLRGIGLVSTALDSLVDVFAGAIAGAVNLYNTIANAIPGNALEPIIQDITTTDSLLGNIAVTAEKAAIDAENLAAQLAATGKKATPLKNITTNLKETDDAIKSNVFTLDKLKDKLDEILKESQKVGKTRIASAKEQLKLDDELAAATEAQAIREKKLDDNAIKLIKSYREAAKAKAELAKGGVLDIQFGDIGKGLAGEIGPALQRTANDFENKLKSISLGDVLSGVADIGAEIASSIGYVLRGNFFSDIFTLLDEIATSPEKVTETFRNIRDTIITIIKQFPTIVAEFVKAIPELVSEIAKLLPELVTTILDALPKIVSAMTDAFVTLLPGLLEGIRKLIEKLPEILSSTIAALPQIFSTILKALPGIITALFKAIPEIFAQIVDIVDDLVIAFAENIGPIITSLVDGLANAMPIIVDALMKSLINEIETGRMTSAIVKGLIKAIPNLYASIGKAYISIFKTAAEATGRLYSAIFKKIFNDGVVPITAGIIKAFQEAGKALPGIFQQLFTGIRDAIVYAGLRFSEIVRLGFSSFATALQEAPAKFTEAIGGLPEQIRTAFTDSIELLGVKFQELAAIFTNGATNFLVGVRTAISEFGATLLSFVTNLGSTILSGFQTAGETIFTRIRDAVSGAVFKVPTISVGRPAWLDELRNILKGGIGGGGGAVTSRLKLPGFATGGVIPQGFPGDTFPAKLTSGEMVIPAGDVARLSQFLDMQAAGGASHGGDSSQIIAAINALDRSGEKQLTINIQVGQESLAKAILNINRQGFRTA